MIEGEQPEVEHHGARSDRLVNAIAQAAYPLTGSVQDYDPLLEAIGDARLVLLGEASHGTYLEEKSDKPERFNQSLFDEPRNGSLILLRNLHNLWLMTQQVQLCWVVLDQAAKALRDKELEAIGEKCSQITQRQSQWLMTGMKQAAPQILVVAA